MAVNGWSLIGRLKRAVNKIRFLLNFDLNRWKLVSRINPSSVKRRVSFNDRPGLRGFIDDSDSDSNSNDLGDSSRRLTRTMSSPGEDDIDKRADMFIANFYKQLKIERQISLELRYINGSPSP